MSSQGSSIATTENAVDVAVNVAAVRFLRRADDLDVEIDVVVVDVAVT